AAARTGAVNASCSIVSERLADLRHDFRPEQLDRLHHLVVRQRADAELDQEAIVLEELVLVEDLLRHLRRTADEQRAMQPALRLELAPRRWRPAALLAELCHDGGEGRKSDI